jgi:uncharacterized membrane protein HdeD (DUF308 family)
MFFLDTTSPSAGSGIELVFLVVLLIAAGIVAYFYPTINAWRRKHHNLAAIAMLNTLLGWTFIGWVACAVWSFTKPSPATTVIYTTAPLPAAIEKR